MTPSRPSVSDEHDPALDALLGRLEAPMLRSGFEDRVLHCVAPENRARPWKGAASLGAVACALTICAVNLFTQSVPESAFPASASVEERLVAALRSPELFAEDLPLVAKLSEILEAELSSPQLLWSSEN